jgi:hypothetical protein
MRLWNRAMDGLLELCLRHKCGARSVVLALAVFALLTMLNGVAYLLR